VLLNYVITSIPSNRIARKVLDTSYEQVAIDNNVHYDDVLYGSYKYQHGNEVPGLKEGLSVMKEGGKSRLMFKSDLGYGAKGSNLIDPYTSLIYDVQLVKVIPDIQAYELEKIDNYLDTIPEEKFQGIFDEETESTMFYVEDRVGSGTEIANDTVVNIVYRGYLADGRVFDTNVGGDTLKVTVGAGGVIKGWDIGLTYFRRGGEGRLVIPYQLAYGEEGEVNYFGKTIIPPYETLIFDIEVAAE